MPAASAPPADVGELLSDGHRFAFFQAVRLLQQANPTSVPVGYQGPPERECLRFRPALDYSFPTGDVTSIGKIATADGSPRYELITTFLGLYGNSSPLPCYYTETLIALENKDNTLVRRFLDLFHHRLISLFYRIWTKYRCAVSHHADANDYFSGRLLTMLGLGHGVPTDHVRPEFLLAYAGLITQQSRSAAALETVLNDYFADAPITIDQCIPRWLAVSRDQRNALGRENSRLGQDCLVGERVFNCTTAFGITIGPLDRQSFGEFLPGGDKYAELQELVDVFNSDWLDYEVTLVIPEHALPGVALCQPYSQLGRNARLGGKGPESYRVSFSAKERHHA